MTIKELKALCRKSNYQVKIVNTYTGQNWDNVQSKRFALFLGSTQLNPYALKDIGFDHHFKENCAKHWLFYDGVLGMSREFNIVYNLSHWLYKDGYKLRNI